MKVRVIVTVGVILRDIVRVRVIVTVRLFLG